MSCLVWPDQTDANRDVDSLPLATPASVAAPDVEGDEEEEDEEDEDPFLLFWLLSTER